MKDAITENLKKMRQHPARPGDQEAAGKGLQLRLLERIADALEDIRDIIRDQSKSPGRLSQPE